MTSAHFHVCTATTLSAYVNPMFGLAVCSLSVLSDGIRIKLPRPAVTPDAAPPPPAFDWLRSWYPINVLDTMDPTKPHAAQLLGLNLVAWNDGPTCAETGLKQPGNWRVFDDACPHRLGPLSEGRVEADGNLLCSYHGWRFDGDGGCAELPYASPEKQERTRCSCKARVASYPTREADGLLFVFPYSGPDAESVASSVALPLIDELVDSPTKWKWKIPAGVRDFPCSWDAMVENTLDPAHFCSAHHGTLGNRYTDPQPYSMQITRKLSMMEGFEVNGDLGRLAFKPPCLVTYAPNYEGMPFDESLVIATYCVPTKPGWVRPLANVLYDKEATLGYTLAERALAVYMGDLVQAPAWLGHILSSIVLHQDAGLLYHQSRNLRERGYNFADRSGGGGGGGEEAAAATEEAAAIEAAATQPQVEEPASQPLPQSSLPAVKDVGFAESKSYDQLTFMPTSADAAVVAFRRWCATKGGAGIPWQCPDVLPERGSEDIYDMWHAHTKHCSHCQGALKRLNAAKYASLALVAFAVLILPEGGERAALALGAGGVAAAIHKLTELFYRYEFDHADNDPWFLKESKR